MAWRRSASVISINCGICCLRRSKDSALRVPWHQFAVAGHTIWIKRHQVKSFIDFSAGNRRTFWQHTWKSVRMAAGILACWAFHWVDIRFTTSLNNSHLVWEGFSSLRGLTWQIITRFYNLGALRHVLHLHQFPEMGLNPVCALIKKQQQKNTNNDTKLFHIPDVCWLF